MKHITLLTLAFLFALLLGGCGAKPEVTAGKFFKALEQRDFTTAGQFVAQDSQNALAAVKSVFENMPAEEKEALPTLTYTILGTIPEGDAATVSYEVSSDGSSGSSSDEKSAPRELNLITENGKWKVVIGSGDFQ